MGKYLINLSNLHISLINEVGSKCSHICPYKREVEGVLTHTEKKAV